MARKSGTEIKSNERSSRLAGDRESGGDPATRQRVIDAAVACILELGFYRASTNAIARQAGVTWGVIQHYFGTRERLMLEVLRHGAARFVECVESGVIDAPDARGRLEQLADVLSRHYGEPEYLAYLQVLLNMDHDPDTSYEIRATMRDLAKRSEQQLRRLLTTAIDGDEETIQVVFLALRGFVLTQQIQSRLSYDAPAKQRQDVVKQRNLLAAMLTVFLERVG